MLIGNSDNKENTNLNSVKDVTSENFMEEVVELSKSTPVIVDFWAPWCGPCKELGPNIEKAVNNANGKVVLAKVNIDENQAIAAQLRVQSIPTVYAFVDGQPVDGFMGAQPESTINEFVKKVSDLNKSLEAIYKEQFEDNLKLKTGQLNEIHKIRLNKKQVARIKTVISEKNNTGEENGK